MIKKLNKKFFSDEDPLKFLNGKFEDMKRDFRLPPKKESLILYRDVVKISKKFFWNNNNGQQWSEILLKSARKEFEANRNLFDSAELGRRLVIGRQAILELEEKVLKVKHDINNFIQETKNEK